MAQALNANGYIYEGVWVNWRRGPTFGLTLTLNPSQASVLSPALAILISVAGAQLWRLSQFALHQLRATPKARPMIYHQTQVTLRTSATDIETLWRLIRLGIAWRQIAPVTVLTLWTVLHFASVLAFGLFSSWLIGSTDEVLSRSPWCGLFNTTYFNTIYYPTAAQLNDPKRTQWVTEYQTHIYSRYASVQQHVDICDGSGANCQINTFRPDSLNWTSAYVAGACPFNSSICHPNAGTMFMSTDYLSSQDDLGFNAATENRVSFRLLAKCAPLDDATYSTPWQNASTSDGVKRLADALYGRTLDNTRNATYTAWWRQLNCEQRLNMNPYTLVTFRATPNGSIAAGTSSVAPIPELKLSDADLTLLTLSFDGAYTSPILDPWFSAQQTTNEAKDYCALTNRTFYVRERPLTTVGCTQQFQVCNVDKHSIGDGSCTPPLSLDQVSTILSSTSLGIPFNAYQNATVKRILNSAAKSTFYFLGVALAKSGASPLKARFQMNSVTNGASMGLPSDQWQTEAKYWMQLILAYFQQNSLDLSTGQFSASTSYINASQPSSNPAFAVDNAGYQICQSQIIHSQTYRNFNFCALLITLIICVVIIVLGLSIEDCVGCCRRRRPQLSGKTPKRKQVMWEANSELHMLRSVDELKNKTKWTVSKNGIPRTHPSYEVSINNLLGENYDLEEGHGLKTLASGKVSSSKSDISRPMFETNNKHAQLYNHSRAAWYPTRRNDSTSSHSSEDHTANAVTHHDINSQYHNPTYQKVPSITVEQYTDSSSNLIFSNGIEPTRPRSKKSNPPDSEEQWPWFSYVSLPVHTDYSDSSISGLDELDSSKKKRLKRAKGSVTRIA